MSLFFEIIFKAFKGYVAMGLMHKNKSSVRAQSLLKLRPKGLKIAVLKSEITCEVLGRVMRRL